MPKKTFLSIGEISNSIFFLSSSVFVPLWTQFSLFLFCFNLAQIFHYFLILRMLTRHWC